jgi:hypothetical protein
MVARTRIKSCRENQNTHFINFKCAWPCIINRCIKWKPTTMVKIYISWNIYFHHCWIRWFSFNTHFMFSDFFRKSCRLWDNLENTVEPDRPQMAIWHMRIACWIPKATNTDSEYVILIVFSLQQWLHKRASMLRYTYIARLICYCIFSLSCIVVARWWPKLRDETSRRLIKTYS